MAILSLMVYNVFNCVCTNLSATRKISTAILDSIKTLVISIVILFLHILLYFQCSLLFCLTLSVISKLLQYIQIHFILEDIFGGAPP